MAYSAGIGSLAASAVKTDLGTTSIILSWVSFTSITIVGLGLIVMILSIQILDRLIDETDGNGTNSKRVSTIVGRQTAQQALQLMPQPRWDDGDE